MSPSFSRSFPFVGLRKDLVAEDIRTLRGWSEAAFELAAKLNHAKPRKAVMALRDHWLREAKKLEEVLRCRST